MTLGYEFAPVDVSITTHPKAFAAGIEAMGLWLWAIAFAKQHRTEGRVHRAAVLGAWGGRRNVMLAKRLVEAGLWSLREDGDWEIHNFVEKGPGSRGGSSSKERMRDLRAREKSVTGVTSLNPSQPVTEGASRDGCASLSPSVSVSSLSSGGAGGARGLRADEPLTETRRGAFEALTQHVPARPIDPEWQHFVDDRIKRSAIFGSDGAVDADWRIWVQRQNKFAAEDRKNGGPRRGLGGGPRGDRQPHDTGWLERMGKTGTGGAL